MNGPIWTLTWEITCYIAVIALGLFFVLDKKIFPAFVTVCYLLYLINYNNTTDFYWVIVPFMLCFMFGSFIFIMKDSISFHKAILPTTIILLLCIDSKIPFYLIELIKRNIVFLYGINVNDAFIVQSAYIVTLPIVLIYIGLHLNCKIKIRADISYGTYIYGWPVSQTIVYYSIKYGFTLTPITLTLATLLFTFPLAYLSWKIIESPCLKLKGLSLIQSILSR